MNKYEDFGFFKSLPELEKEVFVKAFNTMDSNLSDFDKMIECWKYIRTNPQHKQSNMLNFDITKADDDKRLVFGWFSVTKIGENDVIDGENDTIDIADLEKAAYNFVMKSRIASESHQRLGVGVLVESMMFTKEKQAALGIDLGKEGWFGGFYVPDDKVWKAVKDGQFKSFSIGGTAVRTEVNDGEE